MDVDLGRGTARSLRTEEPKKEEVPVVRKKWQVTYLINYIDPVERTKVIEVEGINIPSSELIKKLITQDDERLRENTQLIQILLPLIAVS